MNKLEVKIPWWYYPFIIFMPNFWNDLPREKHGRNYQISIITVKWSYSVESDPLGNYDSLQLAYLRIRWKVMWKDFFTSNYGLVWKIKELKDG